jgi:hypothetical protein
MIPEHRWLPAQRSAAQRARSAPTDGIWEAAIDLCAAPYGGAYVDPHIGLP